MPIAPIVTALPHRLLVTLALMFSMHVHALTLGRIQGAALIGRPLDVSVQVQLDPNQSITSACFEADVFHADTRQNPAGVKVRLEPVASPQGARLRITSDSRIDEPIVTVYVRAGCAQMSSRRYVLLADIVSEQAEPMPRVTSVPLVDSSRMSASSVPAAGAPASDPTGLASARAGGRPDSGARPSARKQPRAASEVRRGARTESKRVAPAGPASEAGRAATPIAPRGDTGPPAGATARQSGSGQSRLKLDPLEMLSERVATLESNGATASAPTSEREAREVERLDRLEASVKALLVLAEKNEASLLDVRGRLERAQSDRFGNTVTYALFGLLLLSLLAIAYLLARMSRAPEASGSRWFEAAPGSSEPDAQPPAPAARSIPVVPRQGGSVGVSAPAPLTDSGSVAPPAGSARTDRSPTEPTQPMAHDGVAPGSGVSNAQVDVSLVEMSASTFDRLMQSGAAHGVVRHAAETVPMAVTRDTHAQAGPPTVQRPRINADELIDIRQRAEFFVTLGQTDQAVQVLEARIAQDGASCPQAFLDLFKLFHSLGLKADFDQLQSDFVALFNARVPAFADFDDEGRSLEDYPGVVDRLIRVWSRPTAIDTLEQMVYRRQIADADADALDLAAFRDLLMLHAVAQTVRSDAVGRSGAFESSSTTAGQGNQLDIDLSELIAPDDASSTLVMPQNVTRETVDRQPRADVDVPVDGETVADSAAVSPPHNLIDFDLTDIDLAKKPHTDS